MNVLWYMCAPDGAYPWNPEGARTVDYSYFQQLAKAYDRLGFTGALFATGAHDVWVLAAALLPETTRMRFLVAIHPGLMAPTLLAKMAATFQEFSQGRLLINVVSGDARMLGAYGMKLPHDERYTMADEYLSIWHRLMAGESVTYEGRYFSVEGAKLAMPAGVSIDPPPLWFGGSSDAAIEVAAKHTDTYLSWGETPEQIKQKINAVRERAKHYGRELSYGIRLYVIVRETDAEAWDAAERLYGRMDEASIALNQRVLSNSDSVGQTRMSALHGGVKPDNLRDLEVAPNLWAGIGLVRPGPGTAIVGSPDTVVRTLEAYQAAGVDTFILSGMPLLEEAYRFADLVLPKLPVARDVTRAKSFTCFVRSRHQRRQGGRLRAIMILDERSYLIKPEHVKDYLETYEREGMALQVSHLGDLVGWFTTDVGTVNEVVHIWRYQDMGDRERRRAAMEADPAWQAFRRKTSAYVIRMRNRILRPTSFSPMR